MNPFNRFLPSIMSMLTIATTHAKRKEHTTFKTPRAWIEFMTRGNVIAPQPRQPDGSSRYDQIERRRRKLNRAPKINYAKRARRLERAARKLADQCGYTA